jgi:hypothetical protein
LLIQIHVAVDSFGRAPIDRQLRGNYMSILLATAFFVPPSLLQHH